MARLKKKCWTCKFFAGNTIRRQEVGDFLQNSRPELAGSKNTDFILPTEQQWPDGKHILKLECGKEESIN
ncbi:hypothetical protein LH29_11010 [Draconibacterium sediminis]|uniref:Uncharacterized protein n=1 Tax=Draconibacterium sediminis TaxID=1544798 RepID=A0A0D8J9P0_9BACT|nr:hypothetical protein LH29_11010 [Draconibacterium sediminis]